MEILLIIDVYLVIFNPAVDQGRALSYNSLDANKD